MSKKTELSNYIRAINVAGAVVAAQDNSEASPKDVAAEVGELAAALAKVQNKYISKNDLEDSAPSGGRSSSGSTKSSGSKGSGGPSAKQRNFVKQLINAIEGNGDDATYTLDDVNGLSGRDVSDAIEELIAQRDS